MPATLDEAAQLLNAGDLVRAQAVIAQLLKQDLRNAQAWFLLAQCVTDPVQRHQCLERTLALDPHNELARQLIDHLQPAASPIVEVPPPQSQPVELSDVAQSSQPLPIEPQAEIPADVSLTQSQPFASHVFELSSTPSDSAPFQPRAFELASDIPPASSQPFTPQPFQLANPPSDTVPSLLPTDSLPVWFRNPHP